ncbi:hypothetical protein GW17_00058096 [Ensete ventricosum]|nr:hypothetical protein GW17_00058096 [Ensete ventricosum]
MAGARYDGGGRGRGALGRGGKWQDQRSVADGVDVVSSTTNRRRIEGRATTAEAAADVRALASRRSPGEDSGLGVEGSTGLVTSTTVVLYGWQMRKMRCSSCFAVVGIDADSGRSKLRRIRSGLRLQIRSSIRSPRWSVLRSDDRAGSSRVRGGMTYGVWDPLDRQQSPKGHVHPV